VPRPAHPHAMQPSRAGRTRTAPPSLPDKFPFAGRYLAYTLFDLTGIVYFVVGFGILRLVWALGSGPEAWQAVQERNARPGLIAFHVFALACVVFVAVRFFRLFPKAQPPRIGPAKPPPGPVIHAMLYAVWLGVTLVFATILAGGLF
jgi:fumarate reductase subunit C